MTFDAHKRSLFPFDWKPQFSHQRLPLMVNRTQGTKSQVVYMTLSCVHVPVPVARHHRGTNRWSHGYILNIKRKSGAYGVFLVILTSPSGEPSLQDKKELLSLAIDDPSSPSIHWSDLGPYRTHLHRTVDFRPKLDIAFCVGMSILFVHGSKPAGPVGTSRERLNPFPSSAYHIRPPGPADVQHERETWLYKAVTSQFKTGFCVWPHPRAGVYCIDLTKEWSPHQGSKLPKGSNG